MLDAIFSLLGEAEPFYPDDVLTDFPQRLAVADIVREKLLELTRQEIPHYIAVLTEEFVQKKNNVLYIRAVIYVDSDSQKKIVVGAKGAMLKKAGELSRKEFEEQFEKKVYLDLWVKVKKDWGENPQLLKELGYIL